MFGEVEAALRTRHPVRTLVEEIVCAIAMSEIVELPGLVGGSSAAHDFLVHKHFNGTKVAREVPSVSVRLSQFRWSDLGVMLRRSRRAVAEPFLEFKQRHRLFGVEQLRGNRRPSAMAGDVAAHICSRYPRLPAGCGNQNSVHITLPDNC